MITWPNADTDWAPYLTEITQTYLALAKIIAQHEKLIIAAQNPEDVKESLSKALSKKRWCTYPSIPAPSTTLGHATTAPSP
jgi:agmatine/peptidylarginine deiminase